MESRTLPIYKPWLETATPEQVAHVDAVYVLCERNYENGGDVVVEAMGPEEILEDIKTLDDAKVLCGLVVEQALNARWGADDDSELNLADRYGKWED